MSPTVTLLLTSKILKTLNDVTSAEVRGRYSTLLLRHSIMLADYPGHDPIAHNFPATMLSRAQNHWSPEMYAYINKPDRMLILYDVDEKIGTKAAETFVQRGVDNVFLLSGGLRVLCDKIPEGIVIGELPGSKRVKGAPSAAGPMYATLTKENIEQIREQLETVRLGAPSTIASSRATSRAGGTSRAHSRTGAASVTSSKAWK